MTVRIAVIGDLMLDVLVEPGGPLHPGDDTPGRIRMESGGQAANVAAWVVALGGRARLVCVQAGDLSGTRARANLAALGVEIVGPSAASRGGVVVSIIDPSGQRSLVSDPGCTRSLRPEHLEGDWLAGCAWLHVSGYHLFDDDACAAALRGAALARDRGARVSLDLAYAARVRELGPEEARRRIEALGPELVFQTAEEADALGATRPPGPVTVVKHGAGGCAVLRDGERAVWPAEDATVIDTTGAGDAFAAGFLLAGDLWERSARGGLSAAARCVTAVGAMPPRGAPVEMGVR